MSTCSSTTTCLKGVYNPISPSQYKQCQILRYKKTTEWTPKETVWY